MAPALEPGFKFHLSYMLAVCPPAKFCYLVIKGPLPVWVERMCWRTAAASVQRSLKAFCCHCMWGLVLAGGKVPELNSRTRHCPITLILVNCTHNHGWPVHSPPSWLSSFMGLFHTHRTLNPHNSPEV